MGFMSISLKKEMKKKQSIRWWPAIVITLLAIIILIWVWSSEASSRQVQILTTGPVLILTSLFLLIWALFFARIVRKIRFVIFGLFVLGVLTSVLLLDFRGVSGDVVPVLEWRWSKIAGEPTDKKIIDYKDTTAESAAIKGLTYNFPQFLGPDRNAIIPDLNLDRDWATNPPTLIWRRQVGAGWSGFAVVGDYAITQEQNGQEELVVAYDLSTGNVRWIHKDVTKYEHAMTGDGPRATPTISGDRVYSLGGNGLLNCLDLASGKKIWARNVHEDHQALNPEYGTSCSPLVLNELVIVTSGGRKGTSLVSYNKHSGDFVWGGGDDPASYSSPIYTTIAGIPQIIIFTNVSLVGHDPTNGKVLWRQPWPSGSEHVAQPVILPEDRILVSTGYGIGSKLFKIEKKNQNDFFVKILWESRGLKAKFANFVYKDEFIYGLDDGILVCIDLVNGKRKWKSGRYGHGQIILVGDLILIMAEKGYVALSEARPEKHNELARFKALKGKTWNSPTLAGNYLLVRNNKEAACFELPVLK